MAWKDLPYWLKGGIIAVIILIILFLLLGLVTYTKIFNTNYKGPLAVIFSPFMLIALTYFIVNGIVGKIFNCPLVDGWFSSYDCSPPLQFLIIAISIIFFILIFFLVGALIGLMVDKVKKNDF